MKRAGSGGMWINKLRADSLGSWSMLTGVRHFGVKGAIRPLHPAEGCPRFPK